MRKVLFDGEFYDLTEHADGSKTLTIDRNKRGFKIKIHVSGNKEENSLGISAVKDFLVKKCL